MHTGCLKKMQYFYLENIFFFCMDREKIFRTNATFKEIKTQRCFFIALNGLKAIFFKLYLFCFF